MNSYAYEVLGVGCHTEDDCRPVDVHMVVYLPLYTESNVYQAGKLFDQVTKDGNTTPRFTRITDPTTIEQLRHIKEQMYP